MDELQSLADLLDLQAVDSAIDRLLDQRQGLPELDRYREAHAAAEAAQRALDGVDNILREVSLGLDKAEGELELSEQKLDQQEQRLFAGGLSARETEHMRLDVEQLRKQKGEMEEQVLELLDRREVLEAEVDQAREAVSETKSVEASLEQAIAAEWKTIDAEIARKEERKADIVPLIPPDLLELYDRLRSSKEGVAVGRLAEGICGGCHLRLSAAEQQEVLRADPPRCLHCRRILVP